MRGPSKRVGDIAQWVTGEIQPAPVSAWRLALWLGLRLVPMLRLGAPVVLEGSTLQYDLERMDAQRHVLRACCRVLLESQGRATDTATVSALAARLSACEPSRLRVVQGAARPDVVSTRPVHSADPLAAAALPTRQGRPLKLAPLSP